MRQKLLTLLIFLFITSGCSIRRTSTDFPFELMLSIKDLSSQYAHSYSNLAEVGNGISCINEYKNVNDVLGSKIYHEVAIFPDIAEAKDYYLSQKTKLFSSQLYIPSEYNFSPHNASDTYDLGCWEMTIENVETKSCRFLQLHENLVIEVFTNVNDKNLSFAEFNLILARLDSRLPDSQIKLPNK